MTFTQQIEKDFLAAYKAKEDVRVAVLRMLKTAAKNKQVDLRRELTDAEMLEVVAKQVKQRQESIEMFRTAGRDAQADQEHAEMVILQAYLPTQLTAEETAAAVDAAVTQAAVAGAVGMKDMGRVIQAVMGAHKGRVDGKLVSELVKARLSS